MEVLPPAEPEPSKPSVWGWYVVLCVANAALNVGLIYLGVWLLGNDEWLVQNLQLPKGSMTEASLFYIVAGIVFGIGNLVLPFLPKRPWTWVLHFANIIAAGLTCILLPIALPVFLGWLKPGTKAMFDFR